MHLWNRTTRSAAVAAFAVVAWLLFTLTSAASAEAGAITSTQIFKDVTQRFAFANPCTGAPATVTITFNGVMHVTFLPSAGTVHISANETGTGVLTPIDPALPSYSGHFTSQFDRNINLNNGVFTSILNIHAFGSDGSTLDVHMDQHFSISATGVIVSFDHLVCG